MFTLEKGIVRNFKLPNVYGSSNQTGEDPEDDPLSIQDLACTIYNQIGINSDKELIAPGARPIEIVDGGKVVEDLLI